MYTWKIISLATVEGKQHISKRKKRNKRKVKKEEKEKKEKEKKKNSWEVSAVPCQADAAGRALVPLHRIPPRLRDAVACSPLTSVPAHACWRGSSPRACRPVTRSSARVPKQKVRAR